MGTGRPNPRSVDILEHIARALLPSLNPVMLQFFKSQDPENKAVVGAGFQPTLHLTSAEQQ